MPNQLFEAALGIKSPRFVQAVNFDPSQRQLTISIEFPGGTRFAHPKVPCQPRSVSGFTISNRLRQLPNHRLVGIQQRREGFFKRGRERRRCNTNICWCRQRFSLQSIELFGLKIAAKPTPEIGARRVSLSAGAAPARRHPSKGVSPAACQRQTVRSVFAPTAYAQITCRS